MGDHDLSNWRFIAFSERELTFMFAICCRPSICLPSVYLSVCLSVCNARAPYSDGCKFITMI